jgi:hypothetical protein
MTDATKNWPGSKEGTCRGASGLRSGVVPLRSDCLLTRGLAEGIANCQSGAGVDPDFRKWARESFGKISVAEEFDLNVKFRIDGAAEFGPCLKAVRNPGQSAMASDWAKARPRCWRVQKSALLVLCLPTTYEAGHTTGARVDTKLRSGAGVGPEWVRSGSGVGPEWVRADRLGPGLCGL